MNRLVFLSLFLLGCGRTLAIAESPSEEPSTRAVSDVSPELDAAAEAPDAKASEVLASSVQDFSGTQGQGGWFYGFVSPDVSPEFTPFPSFKDGRWSQGASGWLELTAAGGSPETGGVESWAVRRWASSVRGSVTVTLRFFKTEISCGNGMTADVVQGGAVRWSKWIAFNDAVGVTESVRLELEEGEPVDFRLLPHEGQDSCDHAHFSAVVKR